MPPQEQAELWMQLRDRMKVDWHEMTFQEKKAGTCFLDPTQHQRTRCLHAIDLSGQMFHLDSSRDHVS